MKTRNKNMEALRQLGEARWNQLQEQQDQLVRTWAPYINAANKYTKKHFGRELEIHEARAIAQCCNNALDEAYAPSNPMMLREATTEDNIAFLGV
jgi:hypothetical protein